MLTFKSFASGSSGNCYLASDGFSDVLIECGMAVDKIQISLGYKLSAVAGCFITHKHADHSKSIKEVIKFGVDVYAPQDVFDSFKIANHRCHALTPQRPVTIGTFTCVPFEVEHDVVNYGVLLTSTKTGERLLYFSDTYYIKYTFKGLTIIAGEANYSKEALNANVTSKQEAIEKKKRLVQSHMSIDNFVNMLKANDLSQVKQIYLLHLSDANSDEEAFKTAVQQTAGCEVYVC